MSAVMTDKYVLLCSIVVTLGLYFKDIFSLTFPLVSAGLFMRTDIQKMSASSTEPLSTATQSSPSWPSSKQWATSRLTMRKLLEGWVSGK